MDRAIVEEIRGWLIEMGDPDYKEFQSRLLPTVDKQRIIGVRTPVLRKYAKKLAGCQGQMEDFLQRLPHFYYEENNLHGFLLEQIEDYETCIKGLDEFLPYIDNWATCDGTTPKILQRRPEETLQKAKFWIGSSHSYTCRYGIKVLMDGYLTDRFSTDFLILVGQLERNEYYVRLMQSWFFATALAKQYDTVFPFLEKRILHPWVHQKTIQKAVESHRITEEQKKRLKTLR